MFCIRYSFVPLKRIWGHSLTILNKQTPPNSSYSSHSQPVVVVILCVQQDRMAYIRRLFVTPGTPYPTLTPLWRQHAGIRWRWYGESYVDKDWIMEVTGVLLLVFFQLGYSQSRNRKYVFLHHSSLKINIFSVDHFSVILHEDLSCAAFLRKQQ